MCCAIHNGAVKCWGRNTNGQVGTGDTTSPQSSPFSSLNLTSGVTDLWSVGNGNTLCAEKNGGLYCWGIQTYYATGSNSTSGSLTTPTLVLGGNLNEGTGIDNLYRGAGGYYHMVLTDSGQIYSWGYGNYGRLGNGSTGNRGFPEEVTGTSGGWTDLSLGGNTSYAVSCGIQNGAAKCWGSAYNGMVGNGVTGATSTYYPNPTQVSGLTNGVQKIDASWGFYSVCAITGSGGVKCWGINGNGQLGNNTTTNNGTPQQVSGIFNGVTEIFVGYTGVYAIQNGKLYGWGNATGDGGADPNTPSLILGMDGNIDNITKGFGQTTSGTYCARKSYKYFCWGHNQNGSMGVDDTSVSAIYDYAVEVLGQ